MKILTFNLWGNYGPYQKRWDFFLKELKPLAPDLICLQEIKDETLIEKIKKVPGIKNVFSDYESGLGIFSLFPFFEKKIFQYKTISKAENEARKALIVNIALPSQNKMVVANTHLSWKAEDEPIRLEQAKELLETLKIIGQPTLLAGDLNDVPTSKPIREIKNAGYFDLLELLHPGDPNITWDNQNPFIQTHSVKFPDRRIDFLLANQPMLEAHPPQICDVVFTRPNAKGIYPSDHYGVFAEVG